MTRLTARPWVLVLACTVVGAVLSLLLYSSRTARHDRTLEVAKTHYTTLPERTSTNLRGEEVERVPEASTTTLTVTVEDATTHRPVRGAHVLVCSPRTHNAPFRLSSDIPAAHVTSDTGVCSVPLPDERAVVLRIVAAGYVPTELPVTDDLRKATERIVSLDQGLTIAGRVVDESGRGVAGVTLLATHASIPPSVWSIGATPVGSRVSTSARSDRGGYFRVDGLSPGAYLLAIMEDGWHAIPTRAHPDPRRRSTNDTLVHAGRDDVVVKVQAIRAFRMMLLRQGTQVPTTDAYVRFEVKRENGAEPLGRGLSTRPSMPAWAGEGWLMLKDSEAPGVWTGVAAAQDSSVPPDSATVVIYANGYRPATARVTLRKPGELAADRMGDQVELIPIAGFEHARAVLVTATGATHGYYRHRHTLLEVHSGDSILGFFTGSSHGESRWLFEGIPGASIRVRLHDGCTSSDFHDIPDDPASALQELTVTLSQPQGAILLMRDEAGGELWDADVCAISDLVKGEPRNTRTMHPMFTRHHIMNGQATRAVVPLDPGSYRCSVLVPGYRSAWSDFVVCEGSVTPVHIDLVED